MLRISDVTRNYNTIIKLVHAEQEWNNIYTIENSKKRLRKHKLYTKGDIKSVG